MTITAVAAVPAAPMLLPAVSHAQPTALRGPLAELRDRVSDTLGALADARTIVLLAGGQQGVLHDRAVAGLAAWGVPGPAGEPVELAVDTELLAGLAGRGGFPRGRTDELQGDLATLTLLCVEAGLTRRVLPVEVPAMAAAAALDALAAGLRGAVEATDGPVAVVAAGDLSAGLDTASPGYLIDGAVAFDESAVAALRAGDLEALAALGPAEADRVRARGWAPLTVLASLAVAEGLAPSEVVYAAPCGVGQVVLRS